MTFPLVVSLALLACAACTRAPNVWSCEIPPAGSCVQWVGEPDENKDPQRTNCKNVGGLFREDVCPIDDTVFGRCDSGSSSTVYYGRRDVEAVSFRCRAVGGTWHGAHRRAR